MKALGSIGISVSILLCVGCASHGAGSDSAAPPGSGGASGSGGNAAPVGGAGSSAAPIGGAGSGGASGVADAGGAAGNGGSPGGAAPVVQGGTASSDPPAGVCPTGALLCDGFETYASAADLGAAWHVTATAATVQVDATKPFKEKLGLHISVPAGGMHMGLIAKEGAPVFPIAGNAFYGRMMVWLDQYPSDGLHWNNIQATGLLPNSPKTAKYAWGGDGKLGAVTAGYVIRNDPAGMPVVDCYKTSTTPFPLKRWACVEWKFDGVANEMHYWLDGKSLADADVIKSGGTCVTPPPAGSIWQAPVFSNLSLGWQEPNASTAAIEMWLDEVALHTQRIGCPNP